MAGDEDLYGEWRRHLTPELRRKFERKGVEIVTAEIHAYGSPAKRQAAQVWLAEQRKAADIEQRRFRIIAIIAAATLTGRHRWGRRRDTRDSPKIVRAPGRRAISMGFRMAERGTTLIGRRSTNTRWASPPSTSMGEQSISSAAASRFIGLAASACMSMAGADGLLCISADRARRHDGKGPTLSSRPPE
jgi:hypothetical protein